MYAQHPRVLGVFVFLVNPEIGKMRTVNHDCTCPNRHISDWRAHGSRCPARTRLRDKPPVLVNIRDLELYWVVALQDKYGKTTPPETAPDPEQEIRDLEHEIRSSLHEPLGLPDAALPGYDATPPGKCGNCHLGKASGVIYPGLCAFCETERLGRYAVAVPVKHRRLLSLWLMLLAAIVITVVALLIAM